MIKVKWDRTGAYGSSQIDDGTGNGSPLYVRAVAPAPSPTLLPPAHAPVPRAHSARRRPPPPPPRGLLHNHHYNNGHLQFNHNKLTSPVLLFNGGSGIPEMDTICEVSAPQENAPEWQHAQFQLNENGELWHRERHHKITKDEMREHGEELLRGLIEHVHSKMLRELQFVEQAIPAMENGDDSDAASTVSLGSSYASSGNASVRSSSSSICSTADGFRTMVDSDVPRCIFHTSENYRIAEKLLVFVCSSRGLSCGIWSRSLLLQEGVQVGSMVPYFRKAREAGYGILVMNPNMNTQTMIGVDGVERKLPIQGSATQEEHCDHVWQQYIFPSAAHKIHFIAYGYGGVLVTNLIEKYRYELKNRLGNVAFIESSHKIDPTKWSTGFKRFFSQHSICWKRSSEPLNVEIGSSTSPTGSGGADAQKMDSPRHPNAEEDAGSNSPPGSGRGVAPPPAFVDTSVFGCMCLSAGSDTSVSSSPAYTTKDTLQTVFKFLATPNAYEFHRSISREVRLNALRAAEGGGDAATGDDQILNGLARLGLGQDPRSSGRSSARVRGNSRGTYTQPKTIVKESVTLDDFQLLRVVGRGAFGKVMLVRKKKKSKLSLFGSESSLRGTYTSSNGSSPSSGSSTSSSNSNAGKIYAMKVIKKAAVFAKNQVEHTKTERRILEGIDHPFAVKLRYAFQNDAKLFFVMDYYNGGTLHFHLKQARRFEEPRARFYAAQVVLALSHLHTYNVVYRDLKPENILMDDQGFIAITDFGLSSDHFDAKGEGLKTFCGTPEYIAPELIRRLPYGKSVDFWSLGVMLFEMIAGYTPFFNANRKRNFENIVRMPLRFPSDTFTEHGKSFLRGLLMKDPTKRLGSGPTGVNEIMDHPFFDGVDWERLYKRDVAVPFKPMVKKDGELNNIPEFFKRQDVMDSAPDAPAPIEQRNEFTGFTYVDPLPM